MKKIILITQCFLFFSFSYGQVPSSCIVPTELYNAYKADVRHLTIQRLNQINSTYKDSIIVPQIYQDTVWQGLAAIFNLTTIPERDSVFEIYCIHQYPNAASVCYGILVQVDTSYNWTTQWQNLQTVTGYSVLDNLLITYGFTINNYNLWNTATLTTTQEINMANLRDSLLTLDGIIAVNIYLTPGQGNQISYSSNGINQIYCFNLGFGDCPSGCLAHYIWGFKIHPGCSVEYTGAINQNYFGEQFPYPINCSYLNVENIQKQNSEFVVLYPNPTTEFLNVNTTSTQIVDFKICDISGRTLKVGTLTKETIVSLKDFSEGLYFIDFVDKANDLRKTIKIINN